jgi:nitrogenase molybdenum-iron protein beta chain
LAVLTNIERVIPIIHAGAGCGSNQLLSFRAGGGNQGIGYVNGMNTPSSNMQEKEVVFGGEDRLEEQIRATIDLIDGDAYVVATGCIAGMIGDDIESVTRKFAGEKTPVAYVNSSGFLGSSYFGYEEALVALIEQLTEKRETVKRRVNLLGFVPYQNLFWRGNLQVLAKTLRDLKLEVNQVIGDFSGLDGVKNLSSAELTIVVSSWVGTRPARLLEEKYGIPYVTFPNLPVGPRDTSEFIHKVAGRLKLPKARVREYVERREKKAYYELDIAGDTCAQFAAALPFAVVSDSGTAIGITRFLANQAGFTPTVIVINDDPPAEVREELTSRLENLGDGLTPKVYFEVDSYFIRKILDDTYHRVILATSQERFDAQENNRIHLSVGFPALERLVVNDTYAGYEGGISLLEDFLTKFIMPY